MGNRINDATLVLQSILSPCAVRAAEENLARGLGREICVVEMDESPEPDEACFPPPVIPMIYDCGAELRYCEIRTSRVSTPGRVRRILKDWQLEIRAQ